MKKEEGNEKQLIKWFSELNKDSGAVAGGKGANLAEIYNLKIPVPPGFIITAQAYRYFINKNHLQEKIDSILKKINYEDTKNLEESCQKIRELIISSQIPQDLKEEILESYELLDTNKNQNEFSTATLLLNRFAEPIFVAVRSSATTEDLAQASFAGQQDTYLNIKGKDELCNAIKRCFASLFTARATYYRIKKGFTHDQASLAIVVQKMINSQKSGVIFSKDPTYNNNNTIIEAVWGLGEGIVSGKITPDKYIINSDYKLLEKKISTKKTAITRNSAGEQIEIPLKKDKATEQVLNEYEIKRLTDIALHLEEHYNKPQDIEFAIDNNEIFIVQTRPITTMESRIQEKVQTKINGELLLEGTPASPGIGSGKAKIIFNLKDLEKIKEGDILITQMTNPDMVVSMQKASAIVTDEGGRTCHASIISREMGIPCIVGTQKATQILKDNEEITVDAYNGKVYKGIIAQSSKKEIEPITFQTKTNLKVIVDLPSFASRAAQTKIKEVGLTRIEGIIAESQKHPLYFLKNQKTEEYEKIIYNGINEISKYFEKIWVRTSDIRSDEYQNLEGAPKKIEPNPMLGNHGIRFSLKNPQILISELKALQKVANQGTKVGILIPQLIDIQELQELKKIIQDLKFTNLEIGVMIETPAAVQIIQEICQEGIDFISFGTNDLTQYILAVDRNNEEVQEIYNEMHQAVLRQIEYVIRVCKRHKITTSICGQSANNKEMVKFLIEQGIDSISVNADSAKEINEYISKIEKEIVQYTDKEDRKYQPKNPENSKNQKKEIPSSTF